MRWVVESNRPFRIVDDRELKTLVLSGRTHLQLPSRWTVAEDIRHCFGSMRNRIRDILRKQESCFHIALDCWTSPNHRAFMAITIHFEFRGQMLEFLLDFIELPVSHTGKNMARYLTAVLHRYEVQHKILAIAVDNAENNTKMLRIMGRSNQTSFQLTGHVRCFNHVLNLAVKAFLSPVNVGVEDDDDDDALPAAADDDAAIELDLPDLDKEEDDEVQEERREDGEEGEGDSSFEVDVQDDDDGIDELAELSEADQASLQVDTAVLKRAVSKLRSLAKKVINSPTLLLPAWNKTCIKQKFKPRPPPRDSATRWNSTTTWSASSSSTALSV